MTGGKLKPWQIVLFIAALGALGWSVWNVVSRDRVTQTDELLMVDVNSGELFLVDIERAIVIPAKHPDTGAYSLLPVDEEEDGHLRISKRDSALLRQIEGDHTAIDRRTLLVTAKSSEPRRVKPN